MTDVTHDSNYALVGKCERKATTTLSRSTLAGSDTVHPPCVADSTSALQKVISTTMRISVFAILLLFGTSSGISLGNVKSTRTVGRVSAGPLEISSLGCGTWSWGKKYPFNVLNLTTTELIKFFKTIDRE